MNALQGQLIRQIYTMPADTNLSYHCLKYDRLKRETKSLITATQDQTLKTRYLEDKIRNTRRGGLCRLYMKYQETLEHII